MREIKFRAWDIYTKKYAFIGFHPIGEVTIFSGIEVYIQETNSQYKPLLERYYDFELEQFTGLKDKNGKEIYEGDIVTFSTRRYHFGTNKGLQTIKFKSVVVWDDCGFCVSEHQENDTYLIAHDVGTSQNPNGYEVVGNIHEP